MAWLILTPATDLFKCDKLQFGEGALSFSQSILRLYGNCDYHSNAEGLVPSVMLKQVEIRLSYQCGNNGSIVERKAARHGQLGHDLGEDEEHGGDA